MTYQHSLLPELKLDALIDASIATLKMYEPEDKPYWGAFSGGKDSIVIKQLALEAGVNIGWHYNATTIDPPELLKFIKRHHADVEWRKPKRNFFIAMESRGFPTRRQRWCCEEFKEMTTPTGERLVIGVRSAESPRRAKTWSTITAHRKTGEISVAPILHWQDQHVWEYIRDRGLPYCDLYDEGFDRLGCIGCPMARRVGKEAQFKRWPGYERRWKLAFRRIWEKRAGKKQRDGREWFGSARFKNWEEMWDWWLSDDPLPGGDECQGVLELWS